MVIRILAVEHATDEMRDDVLTISIFFLVVEEIFVELSFFDGGG